MVDIGAYRYRPLDHPLSTALIENALNLPNAVYEVAQCLSGNHFGREFVAARETLVAAAVANTFPLQAQLELLLLAQQM